MQNILTTSNDKNADISNCFRNSSCPLCKSKRVINLFSTKDYNQRLPGTFRFVRCTDCGLIYENPRPLSRQIGKLYPDDYVTPKAETELEVDGKIFNSVHRNREKKIKPYVPKGCLLDIGCGGGLFLEYMRRRGWTVYGLDASSRNVEFARDRLKLTGVRQSKWPKDRPLDVRVHVVTMCHLLEHLLNPVEGLLAVHNLLRPEGILVVETPNAASVSARLFGKRWMSVEAPRHVNLFTAATLKRGVQKAGFEILDMTTHSPTTIEYSESLRYLLEDLSVRTYSKSLDDGKRVSKRLSSIGTSDKVGAAGRSFIVDLIHTAEHLVYKGLNVLADRSGAGNNLIIVARKSKVS